MSNDTFSRRSAPKRKIRRDQQYASTLVHYLGVEKALAVCKENTWTGVHNAIVEQHMVTAG